MHITYKSSRQRHVNVYDDKEDKQQQLEKQLTTIVIWLARDSDHSIESRTKEVCLDIKTLALIISLDRGAGGRLDT